jgi:hypothetical protein
MRQPRPCIVGGGMICCGRACVSHLARATKACKAEIGKFCKQSPRFGESMIWFVGFAASGFVIFFGCQSFEQDLGRLNAGRVAFAHCHEVMQRGQNLFGL